MPCPLHFRDVKVAEEAASRRSMAYFHNNQTYDVSTAVSITSDQDLKCVETNGSTNPKVLSATKNKWFVLAVGSDIHAFDLSMGNLISEHRSQASDHRCHFALQDEQDLVIGLHFLPDGDVFVLVLASGKVQIASLVYARPSEKGGKTMVVSVSQPQAVLPHISSCSMAAMLDEQGKRNVLSVLDNTTGIAYVLELPANGLRKKETELPSNQPKKEDKTSEEKPIRLLHSTPAGIGCAFVVNAVFGFVYFPSHHGGIVKSASIWHQNNSRFVLCDLFKLQEEVQAVKSVGGYVVVLTKATNHLLFYDRLNLVLVHKVQLQFASDTSKETLTALDFEFLDVKEYSEFLEDVKLLFKVQTSTGNEFLIRSLDNPKVLLNVNCSEQLVILPHSAPGDDSNIIYVDAFPKKKQNSILIRFVNEAQPSLRLKRLLDAGRYEEALMFARDADLPLDLVYSEVVRKHRDDIASAEDSYQDESFNEMLKYLAMLSDHEEACDSASAILMMLKLKYEHIAAILKFTETKPIKDESTAADIARFRYDLGTYRMLNLLQSQSTTQDGFGKGSDWHNLISSDEHRIAYFDELCQKGCIQQARILFTRYPIQITGHLNSLEVLDKLFSGFEQAIAVSPTTHTLISEFLESELVEVLLVTGAGNDNSDINKVEYRCTEIGGRLLQFLLAVTTMLERIQPAEFPENSLYFASTFKRALVVMQANSRSSDQHVVLLYLMKVMQIDSTDGNLPMGQLNTMIRHLKNLLKIYRTYQCPMSYVEYTSHTIGSICHRILDRVRTTQSVREHIHNYVFPYMQEHKLDRNEMLYEYIKQFAGVFYHAGGNTTAHYNTAWDVLCLQVTEHISDLDLRCRAVIEVASGATPPWSTQLATVVRGLLATNSKVDPKLKEKLMAECNRAELGKLFNAYHIPLSIRCRIMGATALKGLLQFIFKSSDKEPLVKLNDAFKIVDVYEKLTNKQQLITKVECYYLYAVVILQQQKEEDENQLNLMEFFELVKTQEEKTSVACKLVHYLKAMMKPTTIKKCKEKRIHWLSNLLCLLQRYLARTPATQQLIQKARNIRSLQLKHDVFVDFVLFDDRAYCLAELQKFILDKSKTKSLIECCLIIDLQIEDGFAEASLTTLELFVQKEQNPNSKDLDMCLRTYSNALYNITNTAAFWGTEFEPLIHIVNLFKLTLPTAIEWATHQHSIDHCEAFCRISRYISLLESILKQCVLDRKSVLASTTTSCSLMVGLSMVTRMDGEDGCSEGGGGNKTGTSKPIEGSSQANLLTNRRRVGAFLPAHEGAFFDSANIIASASAVASSVVEPPAEREMFTENDLAKFVGEMRNQWLHLFGLLSSHTLLELHARQFAYSLNCFSDYPAETMTGRKQCVLELCKKIFSVAVADLPLAAYCLLSMSEKEIKLVLQELRGGLIRGKSVRVILNLVRVTVFVLLMIKDYSLQQQCVSWLETTLWHKKLNKLGMCVSANQLQKKDHIMELMGEFIKVLIPPSVLYSFCVDRQIGYRKALILSYAVELCKTSSSICKDKEKFSQTIETSRASLQMLEPDEETVNELVKALDQMCPYNYEAIELLLKQLEDWQACPALHKYTIWLRDRLMLIDFLKLAKRENAQIKYTEQEKKWYRALYINHSKSMDVSSLMATRNSTIGGDESTLNESGHPGGYYTKADSTECNFPVTAANRLPFHVFLMEGEDRMKSIIVPIILNEMNIYNASRWLALLTDTSSIMKYSRTMMLTPTINSVVQEAVKYNRQLPEYDLQQIQRLIYTCQNFLSCTPAILIKALLTKAKTGFKNLPLSPLKISILQMCLNITQDCLQQQLYKSNQDQKQIDEYQTLCADVQTALRHFKTELLLEQNSLLNNDIKEAHKAGPVELILYLCSNSIDWTDEDRIDSQFSIVHQVAEINQVDLKDTYDTLILAWLPGSEAQMESAGGTHCDPDATIDFMGAAATSSLASEGGQAEEDLAVSMLYNDPTLTRIVYVLRKCDNKDKARMIANKFEQDASIMLGGYTTKIRIACCLLRYLSNEQMKELFNIDLDAFCEIIAKCLNQRLLINCRMDKSINEFEAIRENNDKLTDFVRSILSPQSHYRQTPEISNLLACIICDNRMTDIDLIAKVAQRLLQLRMTRPLLGLLKYARRISEELRGMPSVATYYARCFEASFDSLDHRSEEQASEALSLVYFLIGCPVEGGSNFGRAKSMLTAANATCASALVEIAGNSAVSRLSTNVPAKRPNASGGGAPFDKKIRPS